MTHAGDTSPRLLPAQGPLIIEIARPVLERAVQQLLRGAPEVTLTAGLLHTDAGTRLLIGTDAATQATADAQKVTLRHEDRPTVAVDTHPEVGVELFVDGQGALHSTYPGVIQIRVIGAGLHQTNVAEPTSPTDSSRWSRIAGALGADAHARLRETRFAVVGCGRTGSLVASTLARIGVSHLTLIDPDRVELHNLDAMDGTSYGDIGRPKVQAVAEHLRLFACGVPEPLSVAVTTGRAIAALREADFICCCVDDATARLATGTLATLFLKPLLDIGVGVHTHSGRVEKAADVRMVLPGERRCLACFGGIAQQEQMLRLIGGEPAAIQWHAQRAGSLRSLNQIAAHLGIGMIQDLATERLTHSQWLRLRYQDSVPAIEALTANPDPECPVCSLAAAGDILLSQLSTVMQFAIRRSAFLPLRP